MAETQIQMEEPAVEPFPRSIISRLKSSHICRNVIGALALGLVAGVSAGGCMGAMAAEMAYLLKDIKINETELRMKISNDPNYPFLSTVHITYVCLQVAILSSAGGVLCGHQAYNLVKRQRGGEAPGKALALAGPVAVLGVAVTGAALGAILETSLSNVVSFLFSHDFCISFVLWNTLAFIIVLVLLYVFYCFFIVFNFSVLGLAAVLFTCSLILLSLLALMTVDYFLYMLYVETGFVFLADTGSMLPIIAPFFCLYLILGSEEKHIGKRVGKMPGIMTTIVFIAVSLLHDKDQPVPLLDPAKFTPPALQVLERIFVIVFGIQMFQASCGADLFYYFVTGGAVKVSAGAMAATAGVLAVLSKVSLILGTGASLGGLLAASGGAGVALNAAGDLGQRYGGHVGRAGAVLGAAVGAFLPLAAQDVKFGTMVAVCAAAIPGSHYLDVFYHFLCRFFFILSVVVEKVTHFILSALFFLVSIYIILLYMYCPSFDLSGLSECFQNGSAKVLKFW